MANGFHTAYGLRFRSELPLPHFGVAPAGVADVVVRRGAVPQVLPSPSRTSSRWEVARGDFLLRVDERLRYRVTGGRHIVVACADGAESRAAAYLMGTVCTVLLQQRGLVTLHASAVCTEQGAVLFLGKSGAGKSTLAAMLAIRGYDALTDDVAAVEIPSHGPPRVVPGYPNLRLWADAFRRLGIPNEAGRRARDGLEKYLLPADGIAARPQAIRAMYVLQVRENESLGLLRATPAEALHILRRHTHRRRIMNAMGNRNLHFQVLTNLAQNLPITRVVRPAGGMPLGNLADLIECDLSDGARPRFACSGALPTA